jgi:type IV secretory pathway protease TraF
MKMRTRKLVGTIALFVLITAYAFAAMLVAIALQVNASAWVEVAYYVIAGLAWVIPAGAIIWWMQRPDREA